MTTWFLSDIHFGHFNILEYDNRPFSSIEEHDRTIIQNIKSCVVAGDSVYFLGDFTLGWKPDRVESILSELPGKWYFLRGNHDHKKTVKVLKNRAEDGAVHDLMDMGTNTKGHGIVLCHYPLLTWNREAYGWWHLHGHDHKNVVYDDMKPRLNVAIHFHGYKPISLETVRQYFEGDDE